MEHVIDCSFSTAYILPDERNLEVKRIFDRMGEQDVLLVPHLWWYEMANIFKKVMLMKRFTYQEVQLLVPKLEALRVTTDTAAGASYSQRLLSCAHDYGISAYDAAYLELAVRKRALLCTLDDGLAEAGRRAGLQILP
jgi:predicted nucleic acid-binding protein